MIGEGTDSVIFRAYHYKQGPQIHAMEASRVMEEWMDIVESVGSLSNLSRMTRSSFSAMKNNRQRDRDGNSSLRRSAPPEAFNIAPRTCDLENLSSNQNKRSGKSASFVTRQSQVKQSLLEALGDLALNDEIDAEDNVGEHVNEIPLPSHLAEYYREQSTRRKSGRKVATTNLAALQEIVAKSSKTNTSSNANVRYQHAQPVPVSADMATEPTNHESSAALEAMSGHLGQNIEWESELNQAVLDDIAASFRKDKKKNESANESSFSSFEIPSHQEKYEQNYSGNDAIMKRSGSLQSFVKHFAFVKQISANLASECTESTTDAISESLGSSFPQLSLDTPATSAPETIPATYQDSHDVKHSHHMARRPSTSNSSCLNSEHSVDITSMDAQDSYQAPSEKVHRPTKRRSMEMVGLEIIVETPNENGTVASMSRASGSEAAHTMSTVHRQNKTKRGKSPPVPLEIPQEIKVTSSSPISSQRMNTPARDASSPLESSSNNSIPSCGAAAIVNENLEAPTAMPPTDYACTSTRFGTMDQPWPELRAEDSYRQKLESGAALRESKIKFISRQVSSRLAGEL